MSKLMHINDKLSLGQDFDIFSSTPDEIEGKAVEWEKQGDIEESKGNYDMACNWYSVALSLEPDNVRLLLKKARMLVPVGELRGANALIDKVLILQNNLAAAYYLRGVVYARLGNAEKAQEFANILSEEDEKWKNEILNSINETPAVSTIPALGTAEEVSQMVNEQFMIDTWHRNKWWYTPNSFANPNPNYYTQWNFICDNWDEFFPTSEFDTTNNAEEYKAMQFSPKINILRGPSIAMHPVMFREPINNDFEKLCQFHEGAPDVLLWAPDIPIHLMLSLTADFENGHTGQMSFINVTGRVLTQKELNSMILKLVHKAWKEAITVKELHPLTFILYYLRKSRIGQTSEDKDVKQASNHMLNMVKMCKKLGHTDSLSFFHLCNELSALIQESGDFATAKKIYGYALSAPVKYRYLRDQEFHELTVPKLHTNLANMLGLRCGQYDEAFYHYKEAIKKFKRFDMVAFWSMMRLFECPIWRTQGWRFKTAVQYMGQYLRDRNHRTEFEKNDCLTGYLRFWPDVFKRLGYRYAITLKIPYNHIHSKSIGGSVMDIQKKIAKNQCHACKELNETLRWCSRCQNVQYCSSECQKDDWPSHKTICKKV